MAYTTINKSTDYFEGKTYLGSSSAVTVSGLQFQPDWIWVKDRDNTNNHCLVDAVRGVGKYIQSDNTSAEVNNSSQSISAFTSDGFTTGTANPANESNSATKGFMSWNWKANGAGSVDSSSGSISATVSANATAGFSIIKFTNPSSGNFTIPHGLGVAPDMLIFKCTGGSQSWFVLHKDLTSFTDRYLRLQTTASEINYTMQSQAPTSTLLYLNSGGVSNANTETICYAFASKTGYSKFGKYKGTSSTDGAFIYTGFKPTFFMAKCIDNAESWYMFDNKREGYNVDNDSLFSDNTGTESTTDWLDILSNGIKFRYNSIGLNGSSNNYIYMAFGQSIVGSNNIPATAR